MEIDIAFIKDKTREMARFYNSELERLQEQADKNDAVLKLLDQIEDLLAENDQLESELEQQQAENDSLHEQLDDKDRRLKEMEALLKEKEMQLKEKETQLKEKETQLNELGKFSVGVAKKSSQEGLEKAIRIYINTSKRKTQAKREVAKTQLLDFVTTAKLEMPDDIMEALNQLDDEVVVPAPMTNVTIQAGGINVQQANTVGK
jgi:chromosome segregation ATPase